MHLSSVPGRYLCIDIQMRVPEDRMIDKRTKSRPERLSGGIVDPYHVVVVIHFYEAQESSIRDFQASRFGSDAPAVLAEQYWQRFVARFSVKGKKGDGRFRALIIRFILRIE